MIALKRLEAHKRVSGRLFPVLDACPIDDMILSRLWLTGFKTCADLFESLKRV